MHTVSIPIILGTNRAGRKSEHIARHLLKKLEQRQGIQTSLIDVRDFNFPNDDYGTTMQGDFIQYRTVIKEADGIIIVSPEYNHAYPGILKSLLDSAYTEYFHKAVGIASASNGTWGGTRMIESLVPVLRSLRLCISAYDLQFPKVQEMFDEKGDPTFDGTFSKKIDSFIDEVAWLAHALQQARVVQ